MRCSVCWCVSNLIMIFGDFPINFRITRGKYCIKFWRKFLRFLESICKGFRNILMKFWENCKKILKKFKRNCEENFKWFQKNYVNIIGKNWSNSKLMLIQYKEILKSFFEIISVKSGKNYKKFWEKLWKNIRNNSHKLKKKTI